MGTTAVLDRGHTIRNQDAFGKVKDSSYKLTAELTVMPVIKERAETV